MTIRNDCRRDARRRRRRSPRGSAARTDRAFAQAVTIRQGYQTNIWGMPTYYLMKSGLLEKRGIKFQEFAVPSGNLTMQQMVARQVDLGTYAGPSFIIGHDRGGLVAIAQIEHVGRTAARDGAQGSRHHQDRAAEGQEDRQPDRLLDRQHLRRPDRPGERPQEGRLPGSPHERQRHDRGARGQDRRRHGQRRALQRHRGGRRARHDDHGPVEMSTRCRCSWPRRPTSSRRTPTRSSPICKAWLEVAKRLQGKPEEGRGRDLRASSPRRATRCRPTRSPKALASVDVDPGFPSDLEPYMQQHAEVLLREKKISAIPDWKKALRPDFLESARAAS